MRRVWMGLGAAVGIAALVGLASASLSKGGSAAAAQEGAEAQAEAEAQRRAPLVETTLSRAAPFAVTLRLRGVTEAARRVDVAAETEGRIVSEPLRKGASVAAGALLCEIEAADRPSRLAEAKARLLEAEAAAAASAALAQKGFSAELTRARDAAALEAAKAAVALAELSLSRTRIEAPFAGRLETDAAERDSRLGMGEICATVIDLDPIHFVGFASEAEIGALKLGQTVRAVMADGRAVESKISFVGRSADARTRTFRVEATAANPADQAGGPVRDGASVTLTIATGAAAAHRAPRSVLVLNDAGALGVMTAQDGRAKFYEATILSDEGGVVALGGLPETAEIITAGQYYVSDGAALRTERRAESARQGADALRAAREDEALR
ncbi:MAG: efflux RND transporter periplasmic adaptor subunit [Pseudomonadota bacterium]